MRDTAGRPAGGVSAGRGVLSVGAPRRLALSKVEAAEALGVSVDYLEGHVMHELRVVRRGRRRLIPVGELERWLEENATRALGA
jgi:excisionase family DNA binding protein